MKTVIFVMITDGEKWYYLTAKKLILLIKKNYLKKSWRLLLYLLSSSI